MGIVLLVRHPIINEWRSLISTWWAELAAKRREDVEWWFSAAVDDYESAQILFKGGKYSKSIHVVHNAAEKALKAAILAERKSPPRGAGGHNLARLSEMISMR